MFQAATTTGMTMQRMRPTKANVADARSAAAASCPGKWLSNSHAQREQPNEVITPAATSSAVSSHAHHRAITREILTRAVIDWSGRRLMAAIVAQDAVEEDS